MVYQRTECPHWFPRVRRRWWTCWPRPARTPTSVRWDKVTPWIPLMYAAQKEAAVAEALLKAGARLEDLDDGWSALWYAACHGNWQVVEVLLRAGANSRGAANVSALDCAREARRKRYESETEKSRPRGAERAGFRQSHRALGKRREPLEGSEETSTSSPSLGLEFRPSDSGQPSPESTLAKHGLPTEARAVSMRAKVGGEGQNRTVDTTIFSHHMARSADLA